MAKAISLSILAAIFWIPIAFAREPQPRRGLRKVVKWFAIYCAIYVFSVLYIAPRLG